MPSIYTQLKSSDRKFIRTEKARIRRQFLDFKKQEEMINELYKRLLGKAEIKVETEKLKDVKIGKPEVINVSKTKKTSPVKNKSEKQTEKVKSKA